MGAIGRQIGNKLGRFIGSFAGKHLGGVTGTGEKEGGDIGESLAGNFLEKLIPFKKGGRIRKTGPAYLHKGEFILPRGVRPTKTQKKRVAKKHKKPKMKKCKGKC